jgi:hypothetical protein
LYLFVPFSLLLSLLLFIFYFFSSYFTTYFPFHFPPFSSLFYSFWYCLFSFFPHVFLISQPNYMKSNLYLLSETRRNLVRFISHALTAPTRWGAAQHTPTSRYVTRNCSQIFAVLSTSKDLTCFEFSDSQYYKSCIYRQQLVIFVRRVRKRNTQYCVGGSGHGCELLNMCLRSQGPYCNLTFNSPWDISYTARLLSASCNPHPSHNPFSQHQTPSTFHSFLDRKCEKHYVTAKVS